MRFVVFQLVGVPLSKAYYMYIFGYTDVMLIILLLKLLLTHFQFSAKW